VSQDKAARVAAAVAQLGYRPNSTAQALRRSKSNLVGLVFNQIEAAFQMEALKGIGDECERNGYSLLVTNAQGDRARYRNLIRRLYDARVAGLFLASPFQLEDSLAPYQRSGQPVIALSTRDASARGIPLVLADESSAIQAAVNRLLELGHRHFGELLGQREVLWTRRSTAVASALNASRIEGLQHTIANVSRSELADTVLRGMVELFDRPDPASVVFCHQDYTAELLDIAARWELQIPADFSLVTFHDPPWPVHIQPSIASIAADAAALGRTAAGLMMEWLRGTPPKALTFAQPATWFERRSIGPAPAATDRRLRVGVPSSR
jgi:DNA-binding LacI/PurR family transcriptional regulator